MEANTSPTLLLTGASGGLGKSILEYFADKNYQWILQANHNAAGLNEWIAIHCPQLKHCIVQTPLENPEHVAKLFEEGEAQMGKVWALINNAGINISAPAHKMTLEDWHRVLNINLTFPFLLSQRAVESMRVIGSGRIIHISSVVGHTSVMGTAAYAASKAGLTGLCKAQAADFQKFKITSNCIAPGYMQAGMIAQVPEMVLESIKDKIPGKQLGNPKNIASAIEWLLQEHADYTTGQSLHINGGLY